MRGSSLRAFKSWARPSVMLLAASEDGGRGSRASASYSRGTLSRGTLHHHASEASMSRKPTKFVFVTGGVVSSIGKGLSCASVGALLEARGLRVTIVKLDPYINVDPGTMSPYQHGEVFVTDDG